MQEIIPQILSQPGVTGIMSFTFLAPCSGADARLHAAFDTARVSRIRRLHGPMGQLVRPGRTELVLQLVPRAGLLREGVRDS